MARSLLNSLLRICSPALQFARQLGIGPGVGALDMLRILPLRLLHFPALAVGQEQLSLLQADDAHHPAAGRGRS